MGSFPETLIDPELLQCFPFAEFKICRIVEFCILIFRFGRFWKGKCCTRFTAKIKFQQLMM